MFVILGASGQTGRAAVDALIRAEKPVRAVVRRPDAEVPLREAGAETAIADVADRAALTKAFEAAEAVYLMNPPAYMDGDDSRRSDRRGGSRCRAFFSERATCGGYGKHSDGS